MTRRDSILAVGVLLAVAALGLLLWVPPTKSPPRDADVVDARRRPSSEDARADRDTPRAPVELTSVSSDRAVTGTPLDPGGKAGDASSLASFTLRGTVVSSEGASVVEAIVEGMRAGQYGETAVFARTTSALPGGQFELPGILVGDRVRARHSGLVSESVDVRGAEPVLLRLGTNGVLTLRIPMLDSPSVSGSAQLSLGGPCVDGGGKRMRIEVTSGMTESHALSEGVWMLDGLQFDRKYVPRRPVFVEIRGGRESRVEDVDFELSPTLVISMQSDQCGPGDREWGVWGTMAPRSAYGGRTCFRQRIDLTQGVAVDWLCPGDWLITIDNGHDLGAVRRTRLQAGVMQELQVCPAPLAVVRVTVRSRGGEAVMGAAVWAISELEAEEPQASIQSSFVPGELPFWRLPRASDQSGFATVRAVPGRCSIFAMDATGAARGSVEAVVGESADVEVRLK